MIKIIKEGTRKECTCEKCGCVFSYEQEDICHVETNRNETEYIRGIRAGYKSLIVCPQCGNEIVLQATR